MTRSYTLLLSIVKGIRARLRTRSEVLLVAQNDGEEGASGARERPAEQGRQFGYNAQTGADGYLVKAGVIDPTKVVRTALQNAASVAALLLATEALVSELPEKRRNRKLRPENRSFRRCGWPAG